MKTETTTDNHRILEIDDSLSIHQDFRKIFELPKESGSLEQVRVAIFREAPSLHAREHYMLEYATQGQESYGMVNSPCGKDHPWFMTGRRIGILVEGR